MSIIKPFKQVHSDDRDTSRITGEHAKCSYVLYETLHIHQSKYRVICIFKIQKKQFNVKRNAQ